MSKTLESQVWHSALNAELKPVAAVMADMGNHEGYGIYPSVEYIAWLVGRSERSVQTALKKLVQLGVLDRIANAKGGRGLTPRYRLNADSLPGRDKFQSVRKGAEVAPFSVIPKGCNERRERVQSTTQKGENSAPDPLVDPLGDPLGIRARANGYKKPKTPKHQISEFEDPETLDPSHAFRDYLQSMFPAVSITEFYKKWYLSRFRQGGIKGHLGRAAPLEHYHADMEFFFGICAENETKKNGNGYDDPKPVQRVQTIRERMGLNG